jgi:hypothetical protein
MRTFSVILTWLCLLLPAVASAQAPVRVKPGAEPGRGQGSGGLSTPVGRNGVIAIEPLETARPVQGAPYIAEAITETTQVLADGNRIERRATALVARDSSGRVRREQSALVLGGLVIESKVPLVTITDPVTRTHITLDREQRVALRVKTPALADAPPRGGSGAPGLAMGPTPGLQNAAEVQTEQLGVRRIEGLQAEGTRTTMTIPVNAIGNESPIVTVSERWFSLDLQVVVLTRRSDPRFGDTVYRLVNIRRTEPAPELFKVPADYRIEEQTLPPAPPRP